MNKVVHPLPDAYWVEEGRFLAGPYPGDADIALVKQKLQTLRDVGVDFLVDLTEEGEEPPYARYLGTDMEYHRYPIRDQTIPTPEYMGRILDVIDTALSAGRVVYVHCWYGIGRTGTVVGAYLVRHGMRSDEVLEWLKTARIGTPRESLPSPYTDEQREFVLNWYEE